MDGSGWFGVGLTLVAVDAAPPAAHPEPAPAGVRRRRTRLAEVLRPDLFDGETVAAELARVADARAQLAAYEAALVVRLATLRPDLWDLTPGEPGARAEGWVPGRTFAGVTEFFADELALLLQCSRRRAHTLADVSLVLLQQLPTTWAALADSRIDWLRARVLAEVLGWQAPAVDPAVVSAVEAEALAWAEAGESVGRLRDRTAAALLARDVTAADRRRKQAERNADVVVRPAPDGMAQLVADLPAPVAAACREALDRYARMWRADGDQRPIGQLRSLVFADLVLRPWDTSREPVTAHLEVVAPLSALTPRPGGAEGTVATVDGQPVTPAHLRELLARLDAVCPGGLRAPAGGSLGISLVDPDTGALVVTVSRPQLERLARRSCAAHPADRPSPGPVPDGDRPTTISALECGPDPGSGARCTCPTVGAPRRWTGTSRPPPSAASCAPGTGPADIRAADAQRPPPTPTTPSPTATAGRPRASTSAVCAGVTTGSRPGPAAGGTCSTQRAACRSPRRAGSPGAPAHRARSSWPSRSRHSPGHSQGSPGRSLPWPGRSRWPTTTRRRSEASSRAWAGVRPAHSRRVTRLRHASVEPPVRRGRRRSATGDQRRGRDGRGARLRSPGAAGTHDRAQSAVRGLRSPRRGDPAGRRRRLAARRRDGRPLRAEPDARSPRGGGHRPGQPHPARLPPDDRGPRALGARVRRARRPQRHGARRGVHGRPPRRGPRPPGGRRAGWAGHQAGDAAGVLPRRAVRVRHAARHDRRARLRRPGVHGRDAAQGPRGPPAGRGRPPAALRRGRRRHQRRHHRAGRRGRRRRLRRGLGRLRRRRPGRRHRGAARPGRRGASLNTPDDDQPPPQDGPAAAPDRATPDRATADGRAADEPAIAGDRPPTGDREPTRVTAVELAAMARARELGESALGRTSPNPAVGAVVLDASGQVVGEGATAPPGGPHAEVQALARAGERARGGTAVVTLEPCAHTGRTGPCADALLAAGVARVLVAVPEPTALAGGGSDRLRAAGVDVVERVEQDAAEQGALAGWLTGVREHRPYVLWKVATTLDGRVAAADGTSRWITGEVARAEVHRLRAGCDAVLVGSGTALTDDPQLTVRHAAGRHAAGRDAAGRDAAGRDDTGRDDTGRDDTGRDDTGRDDTGRDAAVRDAGRQPLRVILDRRGRLPATARVLDGSAPTHVSRAATPAALLAELFDRDVRRVLLEGGPTLAAAFLTAGLVDEVVVHLAPQLLGAGAGLVGDLGITTMGQALQLEVLDVTRLGPDTQLRLRPARHTGVRPLAEERN